MKLKLIVMAVLIGLTTSFSVYAGPDEGQRWAIQRATAAQQKLKQAEAAKGVEQKKLMAEHMAMMREVMDKMATMKPMAGMSMKAHEEWMEEHQKLMQQLMDQMMREHHLLMEGAGTGSK